MKRALLSCLVLAIAAGGLALYLTRVPRSPKSGLSPLAVQTLEEAQQMTLYSVHPDREKPQSPEDRRFHGYPILGETDVGESTARQRVAREIQEAVAASDGGASMCFNPRHGIRVTREAKTLDFLICFECDAIYIFDGEVRIDSSALHGSGAIINGILHAAGIPIAPPYGE